jgi:hypothetical protein
MAKAWRSAGQWRVTFRGTVAVFLFFQAKFFHDPLNMILKSDFRGYHGG